mgnify:CR=1 FL=1
MQRFVVENRARSTAFHVLTWPPRRGALQTLRNGSLPFERPLSPAHCARSCKRVHKPRETGIRAALGEWASFWAGPALINVPSPGHRPPPSVVGQSPPCPPPSRAPAVLGMDLDGLVWGAAGAIWGGEFLLAASRRAEGLATLTTGALPGRDQAATIPRRTLPSHLLARE